MKLKMLKPLILGILLMIEIQNVKTSNQYTIIESTENNWFTEDVTSDYTETSGAPETNVTTETDEPSETNLTTETNVTPETNVTTETDEPSETNLTTETNVTPETNVTTETDEPSETNLTTETNVTPETNVTTETDEPSETNLTTETNVTPETNVTTDTNEPSETNVTTETSETDDSNLISTTESEESTTTIDDSTQPPDDSGIIASNCDGTGWTPYEDEKCFKLIKVWANRTEAYDLCRAEQIDSVVPELISIKSSQEQAALEGFIFGTSGVKVNVWIGAKRVSDMQFKWDDGSNIDFSNWVEGGPTGETDRGCAEMQSSLTAMESSGKRSIAGKWHDVTCEQANYVVCQKLPRWTFAKLQQTMIDTRKNLVPIGFNYIQLPNEEGPQTLWPVLGWEEYTPQYVAQVVEGERVWKRIY